ncbi:peptide-methionine (S)-S-oxide reductase [Mucilaginibacter yixingensis]|uniref:Peptide methionine sulfoxide reductase MsrA n=1 Tax=Mucilaginibacter yixingensis TaxID=1295612 RepID=A0A2T5J6U5_9SPHI|nr:peptide-methionine (S)-S-oxide reductase MsrA [Mucilaginibacter yixingensis]PTQ94877.1 peptide-methionine (S)-S-oxide reductase [Mucilaginibacter yixingensis]
MKKITGLLLLALMLPFGGRAFAQAKPVTDTATFGMGCFWCSEAIFQRVKGVVKTESGFSGGTVRNPSYEDVCTGNTGHAEVVNIIYNPKVVSYNDLLEIFFKMHDPTTLNRQGDDEGTQYRSAIFYHGAEQKALAAKAKAELNKAKVYPDPIVTEITPFKAFYKAEGYHQNYFNLNGSKPYCRLVILPKVQKLEAVFKAKLKN